MGFDTIGLRLFCSSCEYRNSLFQSILKMTARTRTKNDDAIASLNDIQDKLITV